MREESWGWGFTVLRLTTKAGGRCRGKELPHFLSYLGALGSLLAPFWPWYESACFGHPVSTPSFLKLPPFPLDPLSASLRAFVPSSYRICRTIFHLGKSPSPGLRACGFGFRHLWACAPVLARVLGLRMGPCSRMVHLEPNLKLLLGNFCWHLGDGDILFHLGLLR